MEDPGRLGCPCVWGLQRGSQLPWEVPYPSGRLSSQPDKPQRSLDPQTPLSGPQLGSLLASLSPSEFPPCLGNQCQALLQWDIFPFIFLHLSLLNTCSVLGIVLGAGITLAQEETAMILENICHTVEWRPCQSNNQISVWWPLQLSAPHQSPVRLQERLIGMSPVQKVRGGCPEVVIIGLDLRRNADSVGDRWRKCSGRREQRGRRSQGLRIKEQWRE